MKTALLLTAVLCAAAPWGEAADGCDRERAVIRTMLREAQNEAAIEDGTAGKADGPAVSMLLMPCLVFLLATKAEGNFKPNNAYTLFRKACGQILATEPTLADVAPSLFVFINGARFDLPWERGYSLTLLSLPWLSCIFHGAPKVWSGEDEGRG